MTRSAGNREKGGVDGDTGIKLVPWKERLIQQLREKHGSMCRGREQERWEVAYKSQMSHTRRRRSEAEQVHLHHTGSKVQC